MFTFQRTDVGSSQIEPSKRNPVTKVFWAIKRMWIQFWVEIKDLGRRINALKEVIKASKQKKKAIFIDELS